MQGLLSLENRAFVYGAIRKQNNGPMDPDFEVEILSAGPLGR